MLKRCLVFLLILMLGSPAFAASEELVRIPVASDAGTTAMMVVRVCHPDGPGPSRVVIINHGRSPLASERAALQPTSCRNEAVRWFTRRNYIAVMPVRRGDGDTGGPDSEGNRCGEGTDFVRPGLNGAHDVAAAVEFAAKLPDARPDGMVMVGQSVGGLVTVAYNSMPHPRVVALINMAGGSGGHVNNRPNNNCRPDRLAEAMGHFGATAVSPMLWIYTENDSFFAPPIAVSLRDAFVAAGGKLTFVNPGPYGQDGHNLFFGSGGSITWGTLFEDYLAKMLK
jgi:dienelactone hydrolase